MTEQDIERLAGLTSYWKNTKVALEDVKQPTTKIILEGPKVENRGEFANFLTTNKRLVEHIQRSFIDFFEGELKETRIAIEETINKP